MKQFDYETCVKQLEIETYGSYRIFIEDALNKDF